MENICTLSKNFLLGLFAALLPLGSVPGQTYFQQNFEGPGPFYADNPDNGQFNLLEIGAASSYTFANGSLEITKGAGSRSLCYFSRYTPFDDPVPDALYYQVDISVQSISVADASSAVWMYVGDNFTNLSRIPANSDLFARFGVVFNSNNTFAIRYSAPADQGSGFVNSAPLATGQNARVVWVLNNTGTDVSYKAPTGDILELPNHTFDIWVNGVKLADKVPRFGDVQLKNIGMRFGSGAGTVTFDNFWIHRDVFGVLPVHFTYFRGEAFGNSVQLSWETAWEKDAREYVVERSTDLRSFEPIATVGARGTTDARNTYSYTDTRPLPGAGYYRLKQVDFSGRFSYSAVVDVVVRPDLPVVMIAPNPAAAGVIRLKSYRTDPSTLRLYRITGQEIPFHTKKTDDYHIELYPREPLSAGIYLLSLLREGLPQHTRFVVN